MPNPLEAYLAALTPKQREALAARAETSTETLRQTAKAYRTGGKLAVTPTLAARIERASKGAITRIEMSPVCARCPHAKN